VLAVLLFATPLAIAAARRTSSSFTVLWASTNPPDLVGGTGILNPTIGSYSGYNPAVVRAIAHLAHVKQVESQSGIDFLPLQRDGSPLNAPNFYPPAAGNGYGSLGLLLGVPVAFLGRLSTDRFGDRLAARLAESGVDTRLILRGDEPTPLAVLFSAALPAGRRPSDGILVAAVVVTAGSAAAQLSGAGSAWDPAVLLWAASALGGVVGTTLLSAPLPPGGLCGDRPPPVDHRGHRQLRLL